MKKSILSFFIPFLLANPASAYEVFNNDKGALEVYGQLRMTMKKSPSEEVQLNEGGSRTGINAAYVLNDKLTALGTIEYSVGANSLANRLSYFGVSGDFGTLYFGKQYNTASDLWGPSEGYFYGGAMIPIGAFSAGKHNSSIRYLYNGDGYWLDATYGLPEDNANPELLDIFAGGSLAGFDLTFGAAKESIKYGTNNASEASDLMLTAWVSKTVNDLTISLGYAQSKIEEKNSNQEINRSAITSSALYNLSPEVLLYAGFDFSTYDFTLNQANSIAKDGDANVSYIGGHYKFNEFFRVYSEMAYFDGTSLGVSNPDNDININTPISGDGDLYYSIGARVYW